MFLSIASVSIVTKRLSVFFSGAFLRFTHISSSVRSMASSSPSISSGPAEIPPPGDDHIKVFLNAGGKDDVLSLGDAPFEGELADNARDGASTVKEMIRASMVKDGTLSDPPTRQELSAYSRACGDLYCSVMLANKVVLAGKVASQSVNAALNHPSKSSGATPSSDIKSRITKDGVVPYAGIAYAQEVLPESYREMFESVACISPSRV